MRALACIAMVAALAVQGAPAQETVFYKCTDAGGGVSMQNVPCPAGARQDIRRVGEVRTVPVPAKRPVVEAPAAAPVYGEFVLVSGPNAKRAPAPEAATLPPPPPLYQCTTWDGETYASETDAPAPRCMALQVTGIGGGEAPGAALACEVKQDSCTATPAEQLCDAWLRRLDEADFKLRYARPGEEASRKTAFESIEARVKASHCSPVAPGSAAQNP